MLSLWSWAYPITFPCYMYAVAVNVWVAGHHFKITTHYVKMLRQWIFIPHTLTCISINLHRCCVGKWGIGKLSVLEASVFELSRRNPLFRVNSFFLSFFNETRRSGDSPHFMHQIVKILEGAKVYSLDTVGHYFPSCLAVACYMQLTSCLDHIGSVLWAGALTRHNWHNYRNNLI